jgi:hypothetical protein
VKAIFPPKISVEKMAYTKMVRNRDFLPPLRGVQYLVGKSGERAIQRYVASYSYMWKIVEYGAKAKNVQIYSRKRAFSESKLIRTTFENYGVEIFVLARNDTRKRF